MKRKILFALATILILFSGIAYAQYMYAVDGKVFDADTREPIIGATVRVKSSIHTTTGTTTDMDGYFRIPGNFMRDNIVVSYIGYKRKSLCVSSPRETFDIELEPDCR